MCSVLVNPIPWAPKASAWRASSGVSALVLTPRRRYLSAQFINVSNSPAISAGTVSIFSAYTKPVVPSREMSSPFLRVTPPILNQPSVSLITKSCAPATQVLPIPRATTAAWEVIPPRAVKKPSLTFIPSISSGDVSTLTKTAGMPFLLNSSTWGTLNATLPVAAPGDAGKPWPIFLAFLSSFSSKWGCNKLSSWAGWTNKIASSSVIKPSLTKSTAIFKAAWAVLFPDLVWRK